MPELLMTSMALGWPWHAAVLATAVLFFRQWSSVRGRDRDACFSAFLNNNRVGLILFLGLLMHYFLAGAYGEF